MFWHLVQKELKDILGSPRFVVLFGLAVFLVVLSVTTRCLDFRIQLKDYGVLAGLNQKQFREIVDSNEWNQVSGRGYYINRSPEVLGVFVHGIEGNAPRRSYIQQKVDVKPVDSRFSNNPLPAVFGALDLVFVVKVVFSLMAILLTYDAVSGEKEGGTLRLLSSFSVPKDLIILSKGVAVWLCLGAIFLVPMLVGLVVVTLFPEAQLRGEDWARLGVILGTFLLYIGVFVSLGLCVSVFTHRSSVAFLVLLSIWVVLTMVVPRVSALVSSRMVQLQSPYEYETEKRRIHQEMNQEYYDRINGWFDRHLPGQAWNQRTRTMEDSSTALALREEYAVLRNETRLDVHNKEQQQIMAMIGENRNRTRKKTGLAMMLSRVSPVTSLSSTVTDLARTGIFHHMHYRDAVRAYQGQYLHYYDTEKAQWWLQQFAWEKHGKPTVDLSTLPQFQYRKETFSDTMGRVWFDMLVLGVYGVVLFAMAYVGFLRYDVR